ncbi:hypothetical protein ABIB68_001276 [Bradyrhizobium sp. F1.2.2]
MKVWGAAASTSSWPGLSRPSTTFVGTPENVDARDKPGHDDLLCCERSRPYLPANSVGVRPVTWRNAAENAGTLA